MSKDSIVIVGAARTPQGSLLGEFKNITAIQLGSTAIKAAIQRADIKPSSIEEVIMGCVLPAGLGQAPARQAALLAEIPVSTPCTTVNKMCGSGMQAVMFAHDGLIAQSAKTYVAGGMESMTNAPYLIPKARQGYRLGHAELLDHMMLDGLEDAYDKKKPMGFFAEACASQYNISRKTQDDFAIASLERAQKAIREKAFAEEIAPVIVSSRTGEQVIDTDEHPCNVKIEKIPNLQPVFVAGGTITAANSSAISDGAAALVLMTQSEAEKRGLTPLARIVSHTSAARKPAEFTTAPIDAIQKLLKKIQWSIDDVDLFEINEAFAVVAIVTMQTLKIPHTKLNIHGGGCALGHPIGATGSRLLVTLLYALKKYQLKKGIAALCIGGGEATAIAIEII